MRRIAMFTALALVFGAPAFAQEAPQDPEPMSDAQADIHMATSGHSTQVYHGPHRYPMRTRGRAGDPPIVDHSADTLIVEPTRSSITIMVPTVSVTTE